MWSLKSWCSLVLKILLFSRMVCYIFQVIWSDVERTCHCMGLMPSISVPYLWARCPCLALVTHVLQPVGDCLATKKQLQQMQPLCDQNCIFSVADQSATGRRQQSLKIGDQSTTGRRLIANWLEMGCNWSATGWRLVGDRSAMGWRLTIDQTICCVGVIMNKALINCYSMAISISIMSYCLFWGYFPVRTYID